MSFAAGVKPLGLTHKLAKELEAASLLFELPIKMHGFVCLCVYFVSW